MKQTSYLFLKFISNLVDGFSATLFPISATTENDFPEQFSSKDRYLFTKGVECPAQTGVATTMANIT